jgi:flagella basal body P-ring formation protein FlgA
LAQTNDPTFLSPSPLTAAEWATRPAAKKAARLAQDFSVPPPATLPAAAPAPQTVAVAAPEPAAPTAIQQSENPGIPTLKSAALVTGEIVRIGDLVANAGAVAEVAIFRAPDLGQTGSVPASRVAEAVRQHHIIALATNGIEEVTVVRASRAITAKDIEARIISVLAGQHGLGDARDLALSFDNRPRTLHVETSAGAELGVARLAFDPRTRRFDVLLELAGSSAARRLPLRFTGVVTETTEAVVVTRPIAQGDVFKSSDVMIERRPKGELAGAPVPLVEEVLGLAARRALQPGRVIRHADLTKPELVARNETVTIIYEVPGIVLTIRGKAMEPGALGDLINVLNVQSKRTVQATVTGPGRVTVGATNPRFAANGATAEIANAQR